MFDNNFNTLIVTQRGENILEWVRRNDGVPMETFKVHHFAITSQSDVDEILSRPEFAEWKYGISIGYSNR